MEIERVNENVVVTAEQFNPSILGQLWLVRNNLVAEDGFEEGCLFADTVAHIRARDFDLLVVPQRAQLTPKVDSDRQQDVICDKIGTLVSRLPETPYRALGFNLIRHIAPDGESIEDLCRRLFYTESSPVHKFFNVEDGRFGSYLSKNTLGFRLKLTAVPVVVESPGKEARHVISFTFNYHYGLPGDVDRVAKINEMLGRWNDAVAESTQIVSSVAE